MRPNFRRSQKAGVVLVGTGCKGGRRPRSNRAHVLHGNSPDRSTSAASRVAGARYCANAGVLQGVTLAPRVTAGLTRSLKRGPCHGPDAGWWDQIEWRYSGRCVQLGLQLAHDRRSDGCVGRRPSLAARLARHRCGGSQCCGQDLRMGDAARGPKLAEPWPFADKIALCPFEVHLTRPKG